IVSGSCLSASHAYSSITVSPWKVRGLGIFLASGGSIVMRAQSNDGTTAALAPRIWHHGAVRGHLLREVFKIHPLAIENVKEFQQQGSASQPAIRHESGREPWRRARGAPR